MRRPLLLMNSEGGLRTSTTELGRWTVEVNAAENEKAGTTVNAVNRSNRLTRLPFFRGANFRGQPSAFDPRLNPRLRWQLSHRVIPQHRRRLAHHRRRNPRHRDAFQSLVVQPKKLNRRRHVVLALDAEADPPGLR